MGQTRPIFNYFCSFHMTNLTIHDKSIDGLLGTQTWGSMMVGADESTELWHHPWKEFVVAYFFGNIVFAIIILSVLTYLLSREGIDLYTFCS